MTIHISQGEESLVFNYAGLLGKKQVNMTSHWNLRQFPDSTDSSVMLDAGHGRSADETKDHPPHETAAKVESSGNMLLFIECLLLLTWLFSGIFVIMHDKRAGPSDKKYLIDHTIVALHFAETVVLCLIKVSFLHEADPDIYLFTHINVKEHYAELKHIRHEQKAKAGHDSSSQHGSSSTVDVTSKSGYMLSWAISIVVVLGTDLFQLAALLIADAEPEAAIEVVELAIAFWAIVNTVFVIVWSLWVFFISRKVANKIRQADRQYRGVK